MKLLSRDNFRESVFKRDGHKCVVCKNPAVDAHHIIERRLFNDGGYYLENGASLCSSCHLLAEKTLISVEEIREKAGITKICIPSHLYPDQSYTKWGDPILPNKTRMKGELFEDQSVQKILKEGGVLSSYTNYVKYPRTVHLPFSLGATDDDRFIESLDAFIGKEVVVTEKLDGESSSLYRDKYHARSLDSKYHESQSWIKNFHSTICQEIPEGWRICGENLYASHSIKYSNLKSYFYGFSIWNDKNFCLSWQETLEWFSLLNIEPVPLLYQGMWDEKKVRACWSPEEEEVKEGYVVRTSSGFAFSEFRRNVAKFVRPDHVRTSHSWRENWQKNGLTLQAE